MSKPEPEILELSLAELQSMISETVKAMLGDKVLFERDRALGRCPYCHGENFLVDPVLHDKVPCICTGVDPSTILGIA